MKIKKKKGFTLIELIVVIAILGILAAIAIPRLSGFIGTSKTSSDNATAATINTAVTTLIANGSLIVPTAGGTIAVTYANSAAVYTPTTVVDANLQTDLAGLLGTAIKEQGGAGTGFSVTITTTDVKTIPN